MAINLPSHLLTAKIRRISDCDGIDFGIQVPYRWQSYTNILLKTIWLEKKFPRTFAPC